MTHPSMFDMQQFLHLHILNSKQNAPLKGSGLYFDLVSKSYSRRFLFYFFSWWLQAFSYVYKFKYSINQMYMCIIAYIRFPGELISFWFPNLSNISVHFFGDRLWNLNGEYLLEGITTYATSVWSVQYEPQIGFTILFSDQCLLTLFNGESRSFSSHCLAFHLFPSFLYSI